MTTFDKKIIEPILNDLYEELKDYYGIQINSLFTSDIEDAIGETLDRIEWLSETYNTSKSFMSEFIVWLLMHKIYIENVYKKEDL